MGRQKITFRFENRQLEAESGDSIAKALFRAGIRTLSYSVKYKRPRSIHCGRGRCVMCHVEVNGTPGVPSCITPVTDGMQVRIENFRPAYAPLLVAAVRAVPFPAGFYYRMFTRPAFLRKLFLGSLRRMAGVGRVTPQTTRRVAKPTHSRVSKDEYDAITVGAGISGMSAALEAADQGMNVLLVDEYAAPGGHSIGFHADPQIGTVRDELSQRVRNHASITYLPSTTAQGFFPPDTLLLGPGGARSTFAAASQPASTHPMTRVRSRRFIFATGAYDIIPLFENNDAPGVFGARALRLFLERDGLQPGRRAAIYGTGDNLRETRALLEHHGIDVVAVLDASDGFKNDNEAAGGNTPTILSNTRITRTHGSEWITAVSVSKSSKTTTATEKIPCDLLCVAFNGQGSYELPYQAGHKFSLSEDPIVENRTMLPDNTRFKNDAGVTFLLGGELAGDRAWKEKLQWRDHIAAWVTSREGARS